MKSHEIIGNKIGYDLIRVLFKYLPASLLLIYSFVLQSFTPIDNKEETTLVYDEIPVRVFVEGYHPFFLDALYTNKKLLYIDIADLFTSLNIAFRTEKNDNTLTGFIGKDNQTYLIDCEKKIIKFGDNSFPTATGLIKVKGVLYLESSLFREAFGISLDFNYRSLSIQLKSRFELPLNKQQRIEKTRSGLLKTKGEAPPDTLVQRKYHLLKFGTLDWAIASTQTENTPASNQLKLGLGAELFYGEAEVLVNYYNQQKFDNRQLYYHWHWVDNNHPFIKQVQLGTLSSPSISFISAPVIGATLRNTPTTFRKTMGYYPINEYTEPNRDVELYINNTLIGYTKADASGLYHFKVPLTYGYTTLKLKIYGPMGEEKTIERTMNVPYTIMPAREFEYGLSTGMVEDSSRSRFARADFNYGVNRFLTFGGGVEYLSSITTGSTIPFLTTTIQPFNNLTMSAQYAHGVKTTGQINGYLKKDLFFGFEYTRYVEGQRATLTNALEERKASLSSPFSLKKVRGFLRFDYTQTGYKTFKYKRAGVMISAYYKLLSVNSSTQINWTAPRTPFVLSDLTLHYRFGHNIAISPSTQFDFFNKVLMTCRLSLEKQFSKGDLSISYERMILTQSTFINVNFKYDLKFARTAFTVSQQKAAKNSKEIPGKGTTLISESAQGSLAFDRGNGYTYSSASPSLGRGGISFYPFFDQNRNGKFDKGESMVKITSQRYMGHQIVTGKDSILSFTDLTPFTWYTIQFQDQDLENPGWRFKKSKYRIMIDPNQFKRVDVPVVALNEVDGIIRLTSNEKLSRSHKIQVNIYDQKTNLKIAQTLSESDGYFNYSGLEPGAYIARIDSAQLIHLNFKSLPKIQPFSIKSQREGDRVNNIDFILSPLPDSLQTVSNQSFSHSEPSFSLPKPEFPKMTILPETFTINNTSGNFDIYRLIYHTNKKVILTTRDTMINPKQTILYNVQLYTSHQPITSGELFSQLMSRVPGIKVMESTGRDGLYHYSSGVFLTREGARQYFQYIRDKGWIFGYVDIFNPGRQKVITFGSH